MSYNYDPALYNQAVQDWNAANQFIYQINNADPETRSPDFQTYIADIVDLQKKVWGIYQADAQAGKSVEQYIQDRQGDETQIANDFAQAVNVSPNHSAIHKIWLAVKNMSDNWSSVISGAQSLMESLPAFQVVLQKLNTKIQALSDGKEKQEAIKDYQAALEQFNALKEQIQKALPSFQQMQTAINDAQGSGGCVGQITALDQLPSPTDDQCKQATALQGQANAIDLAFTSFNANVMNAVSSAANSLQNAIEVVQNDLQPNPPPPGKIEHGTWLVDWTSYTFPVPEHVTQVNIFVGTLIKNPDGSFTAGGFGGMQGPALTDFVKNCHAAKVKVNISLGGCGGQYDKCWDLIKTEQDARQAAQGLALFCKTWDLDGVDFDYEEYNDGVVPEGQPELIGSLIYQFKKISGKNTSLCCNAGYSADPNQKSAGQKAVETIFANACDSSGKNCAVDRLNVMTYYNPMDDEIRWLKGWISFVKGYGMSAAQVTGGLDDTDAHAYDIGVFANKMAGLGISTCYWYYNPATSDSSNNSLNTILQSYNQSRLGFILRQKKALFLRNISLLVGAVQNEVWEVMKDACFIGMQVHRLFKEQIAEFNHTVDNAQVWLRRQVRLII